MDSDRIASQPPELTADAAPAELTETIECTPHKVENVGSTSEGISAIDGIANKSSISTRNFEVKSDNMNKTNMDGSDDDESDDVENTVESDNEQLMIERPVNQETAEAVDGEQVEMDKVAGGIDPYSYLQRGDFSSEIFKIELTNLPRKFGIGVSHSCI